MSKLRRAVARTSAKSHFIINILAKVLQICGLDFFDLEFREIFIAGPKIIEPKVFGDHRGYFFESYSASKFEQAGLNLDFVQDNESMSHRGVLRGLHFQHPPHDQGKLVRVISGEVQDVIVDIRKNSRTYGQSFSINLSAENKLMFWIPSGFAHGFCTLKDNTIFSYKCTNLYNLASEGGLLFNDPKLNIDWQLQDVNLSDKDKVHPTLDVLDSPF
ncbi:MAG: dTDP-4-dehydrorhamnose 3,5-epimerase [Flavobacteriales bacterium]|nr:dTDP-4-dehydrorhamnose 3,5-epimerase [Flavobacteriales bacterium]